MIRYASTLDDVPPPRAADFFVGWPRRPDQAQFDAALAGAHAVEYAVDGAVVVGFVTAVGDGVLTAFIPWLEVLPSHRGRGIGTELVRRVARRMSTMYSIDLVCDPDLAPFYENLGMIPLSGMGLRNPAALAVDQSPEHTGRQS